MENFLIRDDVIQLDRAINAMRTKLSMLKSEVRLLNEKNQQLQNKPEQSMRGFIVTCTPSKLTLCDDPLEKWKSSHFVSYFFRLYHKHYQVDFTAHPGEWKAYAIRMKMFRDSKPELKDSDKFKSYLEWLFDNVFDKKFIASIALCTSSAIFYQWVIRTSPKTTSQEKFKKLAENTPVSNIVDTDNIFEDAF